MLSIIDLLDFIDLDSETVHLVSEATQLPPAASSALARQLLASEEGIVALHHMFRELIDSAAGQWRASRLERLNRAYAQFSRKYPVPRML